MSNRRKLKRMVGRQPLHQVVDRNNPEYDHELWVRACEMFPDEAENTVIALAEREGVMWKRIPGYGLRFWFRSPEQVERFRGFMAGISQALDD